MKVTSLLSVFALYTGAAIGPQASAQPQVKSITPAGVASLKATPINLDGDGPSNIGGIDLWLHILHNNDGESKVLPLTGAQSGFGGAARFVTLVNNLKAEADTPRTDGVDQGWVMISSGDNILPGVNLNASINNGVPYYDSILFDLIGYSAMTLGNHDFDSNPDVLTNLIAGTLNTTFVSANLDFSLEPGLFAQQQLGKLAASKVVTVRGRQVGIVGATTETLPFISSPRNTIINPVVAAVQSEIDLLTSLGVRIIILSTHLQGLPSELALLPSLRGVDAVIAGGGSELLASPTDLLVPGDVAGYPYPVVANDADGRSIPIVTTVGDYKYVGRLVLGFDSDGVLVVTDAGLSGIKRVSGVSPDAVIPNDAARLLVEVPVQAANDALAVNIIASTEVPLESRRNVAGAPSPAANVGVRVSDTNVGNLVADSQLWEAERISRASGLPIPDVAIQNGGGIRLNSRLPAGPVTELYTYEQLPFTNFLTLVPGISAEQLKIILENAVSRVDLADGRFPCVSGMRVVWDATGTAQILSGSTPPYSVATPGTRIREVVLWDGRVLVSNGVVVPNAPHVNVATIDFLAVQGGDQYPFNNAPFVRLGITYQRAFYNYLTQALGGRVFGREYPNVINDRVVRRN
ncbi:MAG: 5'-nucleotidase C-terminal domain-containing protein [Phycisphaerae bacterium]|nr:5'-nucleotidase C-terminal domain-containing protein [Phycisphaerae bacterium]